MPRSRADILKELRARIDGLEAELEAEERAEADAESATEAREAAEDVKALRAELAELRQELRTAREEPPPGDEDEPPGNEPPPDEDAGDELSTRPGRKKGNLYDWDVDEAGNVVRLDIPHVYSGDDEEDEVELPQAAAE